MNTLTYYAQNNYGNEALYLADAGVAEIVKRLTGKKTITEYDMGLIADIIEQLTDVKITTQQVIKPKG